MARLKVKKYTRANWTDFAHTGPGTLAGRYMRLFWHPVYRAQDLARGQTKPMRIMSEDFTLYRGSSGTPYAVAFRCAHRGTQLSIGSVEGENLRCFYHGWMYDGSGQCVEQPAEPKPFCETVRIRSFPTKEYLALIWVYLGEGEPPPFRRYPEFEEELSVIEQQEQAHPIDSLEAVATPKDVIALQQAAKEIYVDRAVWEYIVNLTGATRDHRDVSLGASPRASLGLFRAARALALVLDRDYVIPDDIKALAAPVTAHRIILSPSARMRGVRSADLVSDLLNTLTVPGATR